MISLLLAAALAQPTPPAPPTVDQPKNTTVIREIRIVRDKDGMKAQHADDDRDRRLVMRGVDGKLTLDDCAEGRKFETSAEGEKDGKKTQTRIVLCGKKDGTDASYAEMLDRAAKRVASDKELPVDARDRLVASINAAIARLNLSRN